MAAIIGSELFEGLAGLAHAVKYCRAAKSEEMNGFAFTAAVEWQQAAELLAPWPPLADRCWRQWERIMRLPRHMAGAIAETQAPAAAKCDRAYDSETEQFFARVAQVLLTESDAEETAIDLMTIPSAQTTAVAA